MNNRVEELQKSISNSLTELKSLSEKHGKDIVKAAKAEEEEINIKTINASKELNNIKKQAQTLLDNTQGNADKIIDSAKSDKAEAEGVLKAAAAKVDSMLQEAKKQIDLSLKGAQESKATSDKEFEKVKNLDARVKVEIVQLKELTAQFKKLDYARGIMESKLFEKGDILDTKEKELTERVLEVGVIIQNIMGLVKTIANTVAKLSDAGNMPLESVFKSLEETDIICKRAKEIEEGTLRNIKIERSLMAEREKKLSDREARLVDRERTFMNSVKEVKRKNK